MSFECPVGTSIHLSSKCSIFLGRGSLGFLGEGAKLGSGAWGGSGFNGGARQGLWGFQDKTLYIRAPFCLDWILRARMHWRHLQESFLLSKLMDLHYFKKFSSKLDQLKLCFEKRNETLKWSVNIWTLLIGVTIFTWIFML